MDRRGPTARPPRGPGHPRVAALLHGRAAGRAGEQAEVKADLEVPSVGLLCASINFGISCDTVSGKIGDPRLVVNTWSSPFQPVPTRSRSSACFERCSFRTRTVPASMLTVRSRPAGTCTHRRPQRALPSEPPGPTPEGGAAGRLSQCRLVTSTQSQVVSIAWAGTSGASLPALRPRRRDRSLGRRHRPTAVRRRLSLPARRAAPAPPAARP